MIAQVLLALIVVGAGLLFYGHGLALAEARKANARLYHAQSRVVRLYRQTSYQYQLSVMRRDIIGQHVAGGAVAALSLVASDLLRQNDFSYR